MENVNITIAANILKYRKKTGLSQEELAGKLGVTFQAVSKWENAKAAPDIAFLPMMADIFGCYIDELFSREIKREIKTEIHYDHCAEFPWADDEVIRGVVCKGRKILQRAELADKFTFEIIGNAKNVQSECNIEVKGPVSGGCRAGGNIEVKGPVSGGCNSGGNVSVEGNFSGGCNTGMSVTCGGNFCGDVNCKNLTVGGDVEAEKIEAEGKIECRTLKCENIKGDVTVNEIN